MPKSFSEWMNKQDGASERSPTTPVSFDDWMQKSGSQPAQKANNKPSSALGYTGTTGAMPMTYEERKAKQDEASANFKGSLLNNLGNLQGGLHWAGLVNPLTLLLPKKDKIKDDLAELKTTYQAAKEANKLVEWEGRKELLDEYKKLDRRSYRNPKDVQRAAEIREKLHAGDVAAGNVAPDGDMAYTLGETSANLFTGTAKKLGAELYNAGLQLVDSTGRGGWSGGYSVDLSKTQAAQKLGITPKQDDAPAWESEKYRQFMDKRYAEASELRKSAVKNLEVAKENKAPVWKAGLDISENLIEMGFDAALAYYTGGSSLAPMAARVFGGATMDSREAGYSFDQQMAYGIANAAVEVFTEKLGGFGSRVYGKGWTDAIADDLVNSLAKTKLGRNALRVLIGMVEEGGEEVLSDLFDPVKYGVAGMDWDGYNIKDILYDFLIGAAVGGISGTGSAFLGRFNAEDRQDVFNRLEDVANIEDEGQRYSAAEKTLEQIASEKWSRDYFRELYGRDAESALRQLRESRKVPKAETDTKPAQKPTLGEAETPAQKRVVSMLENADTMGGLQAVLEQIKSSPALDAAFEELTGTDVDAYIAEALQTPSDATSTEGDTETPATPSESRSEAPGEFNSENNADESREQTISKTNVSKDFLDWLFGKKESGSEVVGPADNSVQAEQEESKPAKPIGKKTAQKMATDAMLADLAKEKEIGDGGIDVEADDFDDGLRSAPNGGNIRETTQRGEQRRDADITDDFYGEISAEKTNEELRSDARMRDAEKAEANGEEYFRIRAPESSAEYAAQQNREQQRKEDARAEDEKNYQPESSSEPESSAEYRSKPQREARKAADKAAANEEAQRREDARNEDSENYKAAVEESADEALARENAERLADVKKTFGEKSYDKIKKTVEKLRNLQGERVIVNGAEAFKKTDKPRPTRHIDNFADTVTEFAEGNKTVRDVFNAYRDLKSDKQKGKGSYFYDENFAKEYEKLADLFESEYVDEAGESAYAERFASLLDRTANRMSYMANQLNARPELAEALGEEDGSVVKRGRKAALSRWIEAAHRFQLRASTAFKKLAGYNSKRGKALYDLAEQAQRSVRDYINIYETAQDYFSPVSKHADFDAFSKGKLKVNNVVPNLTYGSQISANMALSLLKTLETDGAIEHIVENGTIEMPSSEEEHYKGIMNNGFGDQNGYSLMFDPVNKGLRKAINDAKDSRSYEDLEAAKKQATAELQQLVKKLHSEIDAVPIAKLAYDQSIKCMNYLKKELNKTSRIVWGGDAALQDKFYWPLEAGGDRAGGELLNSRTRGLNEARFMQERTGDRGGILIRSFTDAMENYIGRAAHWAAYQELSDKLDLYSRDSVEGKSITQLLQDNAGGDWVKWLKNYEADLNQNRTGNNDKLNQALRVVRSNIAQASLVMNLGVAMKQAPSMLDFATVLDSDIVTKRFLTGALKSAKSFDNNALIQTMEQYTRMLDHRRTGYNTVEEGEATKSGRKGAVGRFVDALPNWMTNWISKTDYRTVANGLLACADQVDRYIQNGVEGYDGLAKGTDAYYQAVADLFERAVMDTQPIYEKEYRADMLRTPNEFARTAAMFRTQQTQNYNNLAEALGEWNAAKDSGDEAAKKAAAKKLRGTIGGQVGAAALFAVLDGIAKLSLHKKKKYEDEDGNFSLTKFFTQSGYSAVNSLLSTSWFGSKIAPYAMDLATTKLNQWTDGKVEKSGLYYGTEDAVLSNLGDSLDAIKKLVTDPSLKSGKAAAIALASTFGLPLGNAYNLINSMVMYGVDYMPGTKGMNYTNEDDFISMIESYSSGNPAARGTKTMKRALSMMKAGNENYKTVLATIDFKDDDMVKAAKSELTNAFVSGKIDAEDYRRILKYYFKASEKDISKLEEAAFKKQEFNAVSIALEQKYGKDKAASIVADLSKLNGETDPSVQKRVEIIQDLDVSDKQKDALIAHYTSQTYQDDYTALRESGFGSSRACRILASLDTDKSGTVSQKEMYAQYQARNRDEDTVEAIWNAHGYNKDWAEYKDEQDKKPVNVLISIGINSAKADAIIKAMDSDGNGNLKQDELLAYLKTHPELEDAFREIWRNKWPKSDFDKKWKSYR